MKQTLVLTALLALAFLSGCSTMKTYRTGRSGLLDQLQGRSSSGKVGAAGREISKAQPQTDEDDDLIPEADLKSARLRWPLERPAISSYFGERDSSFHEGVDLKAKDGTPVFSSADGKVLYASNRIGGYGKMVIIRHTGTAKGLSTIYAHNSKLLVRPGQLVKRGQKIALSGQTGRTRGPHLHFEVRRGVTAIDPFLALPSSKKRTAGTVLTQKGNSSVRGKAKLVVRPKDKRRNLASRRN